MIHPHRLRLAALALLAAASLANAQSSERPRIGLALGGGSARGIAHVGVLEWLEEHRIPIDYVAGTSMGGLVGGAYATGMTPGELRELLASTDWDLTFQGEPPYRDRTFRRKEDRRDLPSKIELGVKDGFHLPSGLDPGHQVGLLLSRISFPHRAPLDFDDLPTPFRAIATDLEASEFRAFEKGSLTRALLATMALPAIFPPVLIEGRYYADGGLLNNVPADVVRAMGADIVIAVDVGAPPDGVEIDALSQAAQAIDVMMTASTRRALEAATIVIHPDLEGFGSLSWRESNRVADRGREAAESLSGELLRYAVDEAEWTEWKKTRMERKPERAVSPAFVDVEGADGLRLALIEDGLDEYVGSPLDLDQLESELTSITGSDRFERISYELQERDGETGLVALAVLKPHGPPFLRFALDMNNETGELTFGFRTRFIALDVGKPGAEVRADLAVGSTLGAGLEYYWTFAGSRMFFAPRALAFRRSRNVFQDDEWTAIVRSRAAAVGGDFGFRNRRSAEVRFGYQIGEVKDTVAVGILGDGGAEDAEGKEELLRFRFNYDRTDAPIIPRNGIRGQLRADWLLKTPGADEPFGIAEGSATAFRKLSERNRLFGSFAGGASFSGLSPFAREFSLGGPFQLSSFDRDQFRGQKYLLTGGGYLRTIGRLPDFIGGDIYVTGIFELGSAFDRFDDALWHVSASGGVILDTLFGPVMVAVAFGDQGSSRFYFTVGQLFR